MAKQTFLAVLFVVAISGLLGLFMSMNIDTQPLDRGLPWQIEIMPDGSTTIFEINLGKTNLAEVSHKFKQMPEYTMFVHQNQPPVIEAYFNSVMLSGLKAKMVMGFDFSSQTLDAIYNRGVRISTMGSGIRKVTMHPDDIARIQQQPISSITYIPSINLDGDLIEKRFGQSAQRIQEVAGTEHWLYPQYGLDIVVNDEAKEILQYVLPSHFSAITEPLEQQQKQVDSQ